MMNFHKIIDAGLFCLVFCICFGLNIVAVLDGQPTQYSRLFESIFISITIFMVIIAVVGDVFWIYVLNIPVALLVPIEAWQRLIIGKPTSMEFVAFAMETTWIEFINFLATHGSGVFYIFAPWVMLYLAAVYRARKRRISLQGAFLSVSAFLCSGLVFMHYLIQGAPDWITRNDELHVLDGRVADGWSRQWEDIFPLNIGIAVHRYYSEWNKLDGIYESMKKTGLGAQLVDEASAPDIVVVVVGESSVPSRWSLFGYRRITTPRLEAMEGLAKFESVVSVSTATRTAVPAALSQQPVLLPTGHVNDSAEPSLVHFFKQAGYRTYWFSNHAPFGKFDSAIAIYSREADHVKFVNPYTYEAKGNLDERLLDPLEGAINSPGKKLVILHTLGSHFNYSFRYPEEFRKFSFHRTMSEDLVLDDSIAKISNDYDNSILYTDYVLAEVIARVRSKKKSAVVAYFSDHGEDLPGNGCPYRGVNRRTAFAYEVPLFFWLSDIYIEQHGDLWRSLQNNRKKPFTIRAVSSTILRLGHVKTQNEKSDHENFLMAPSFARNSRMVALSNVMVDYDVARSKDRCSIAER